MHGQVIGETMTISVETVSYYDDNIAATRDHPFRPTSQSKGISYELEPHQIKDVIIMGSLKRYSSSSRHEH